MTTSDTIATPSTLSTSSMPTTQGQLADETPDVMTLHTQDAVPRRRDGATVHCSCVKSGSAFTIGHQRRLGARVGGALNRFSRWLCQLV